MIIFFIWFHLWTLIEVVIINTYQVIVKRNKSWSKFHIFLLVILFWMSFHFQTLTLFFFLEMVQMSLQIWAFIHWKFSNLRVLCIILFIWLLRIVFMIRIRRFFIHHLISCYFICSIAFEIQRILLILNLTIKVCIISSTII